MAFYRVEAEERAQGARSRRPDMGHGL
jgi:hypothetical protein